MKSLPVSASNQSSFEWDWKPTRDDVGQSEFFAFVKTKMPVIELEIADDSSRKVDVQLICRPDPMARSLAGVLRAAPGCELTGTAKRTSTLNHVILGTDTITSEATVVLDEDRTSEMLGILVFRPTGTYTYQRSGVIGGCPLTIEPTSGMLSPADSAILVYPEDSLAPPPKVYEGNIRTGHFQATETWGCGQVTVLDLDESIFLVAQAQNLTVDVDHQTVKGSYVVTNSDEFSTFTDSYEWDLQLRRVMK
jgi:hypothetical protein